MSWISDLESSIITTVKIFEKNITNAANAGQVQVALTEYGHVQLQAIVLKSNGTTTSDFTNCSVKCGPSASPTVITLLPSSLAKLSNLGNNGNQVSWQGAVEMEDTDKVVITLNGTGATAVNFDIYIRYTSSDVNSGILS